jgi:polysaccharide biosynthesis transport protein
MPAADSHPVSPAPSPGTSLVDRINVAIHLRRYLKLIARRWLLLLLCILAGTGQAVYKAFTTPDKFRAWSQLTIAPQLASSKPQVVEELNNYYANQIVLMKNETVMKMVLDKLTDYPAGRRPWYTIDASKGDGSSFIMTVSSTDFAFAKQFARAWADAFIEYKTEVKGGVVTEAARDTAGQITEYQKKLADVQQKITRFRRDHDIASAKDTGDAAQARLDDLQAKYYATKQERELLQGISREQIAEGALLHNVQANSPRKTSGQQSPETSGDVDPLAQFNNSQYLELQSQLKTKEADEEHWSALLKPAHPYWITLTNEIVRLKQQVQFQLDQIDAKRKATIQALLLRENAYKPMIEAQKKEVFAARSIQSDFDQLQNQENQIRTVLNNLEQRKVNIDLTSATEDTITPIARGVGSPAPYAPQRARMILQGLFLGLAVGLGIVYFLHRLDDRLDLAEDVEAELEEPVLGQIPQMDSTAMRDGHLLIPKLEHHNVFAESVRGVRSAIKFGGQGGSKQVMLVSSAVPGDGKTTFTVNFAIILATAGSRVLLIDADLRRGNTHTFFDHPREPGLSEVLTGQQHWSDVLRPTEIGTLSVLHTGSIPANPGELLIGPITRQLVAEARKQFDYVVFDCPPLTSLDDTFSLTDLADGLLFVVKSGQTSMRFAKNALAAVRQRGFPILGIVFNGITADNPYYYYSHYYHAYYSKEQPRDAAAGAASRPSATMAAPRSQRQGFESIEAQAKARAGEAVSTQKILAEEAAKARTFKARRAAQQTSSPEPPPGGPVTPEPGESHTAPPPGSEPTRH